VKRRRGTCDLHVLCASVLVGVRRATEHRNCVRTVSHTRQTQGRHGDLRERVDAYRCCVQSFIGNALVGIRVRQHARAESLSKRAPSTTRTSSALESTAYGDILEAIEQFVISPRKVTAVALQYGEFWSRSIRIPRSGSHRPSSAASNERWTSTIRKVKSPPAAGGAWFVVGAAAETERRHHKEGP
jgi:hypothetical protein